MRYIAVLLTAILSLSCAANAGGIWGEPAEIAPIQTTGSSNDPLVGQANVTRPPAASSSKTNGLASGGTGARGHQPDQQVGLARRTLPTRSHRWQRRRRVPTRSAR